ncbi:uncharacterized protein LOC113231705 isoform X1 [Hyposmocoma kahamanoa]|uniref:uncharacterized protein LOC113231705 isoform X1 n=1 Tax=Hyposmocoma kahamanoa TaxID=1477025 RepID=UPI000E6D6973|nr:uncharacterized protein LOC113231705 isoform X1 [Hyposmocoma kahamanoa]
MRLTVDNLSRTIRTPVWCLIVIMVIIAVEVSSLNGPNVCIEKQKYNITKRVKYRAPMSVRTYVWCFAMPPRCSRWNTEMRDLTRLETEERTAEMVVCCPGYKMKDISCVPICPHGKTGHGCTEDCPPNKWGPSCVNDCRKCKNGICSPITGECLCQDGWQGESCDIIIPTTTPAVPMMEQILTSVKTTASTKTTSLSTITPTTIRSTTIVVATSTLPTTTMVLSTKATVPNTTITSTTNTMDESKTTTTVSKPAIVYKNMSLSDISKMAAYNPVNNDEKTDVHLIKSVPVNQTKTKDTFKTVPTTSITLSSESATSNAATEHKMLLTTLTEIRASTAVTTMLTTVIPKTSPTTEKITTSELEKTTTRTEITRQPEMTVRQPTTIKFKPKEIWIRPAQKEPEHITAVMGDKEKDRPSVDLISVISIAGGVMMAIITVAVIIVMVERCKKPRYEDVRKYNDIRMQVLIDNNDVPPPPYVRSIFHTPLPEPPTSEKCHYQPISTLDRNLKQFMRPVVVQTISPLMLENFRGILECHYDHLPRRSHDLDTMQARCSVPPSVSEREELLPQRVHSLTDSDIEAMKCEAKQDVIDNTTSEPLYAEIPCWRPPSEHAIEVVNLNGEAVTEL